ncbi:MAG TPA: hypothetical protein PKE27_18635 [Povalibacter sp.]|nr:hypothetical protein [Povalibacter sp.]
MTSRCARHVRLARYRRHAFEPGILQVFALSPVTVIHRARLRNKFTLLSGAPDILPGLPRVDLLAPVMQRVQPKRAATDDGFGREVFDPTVCMS